MVDIAIVATGDPIPVVAERFGGFAAMIRRAAGNPLNVSWRVVDARLGLPSCPPPGIAGIVITGSPHSVTEDAPWMQAAKPYLQSAVVLGIPTLGICFGHQLLAASLGGTVEKNPRGPELGIVQAQGLASDPVLQLPYGAFPVTMAHEDTAAKLPAKSVVLARTDLEPHAAVRFSETCWGVQFHPEFTHAVLGAYISAEVAPPRISGGSPANATRVDVPLASRALSEVAHVALLSRFVRFASRRHRSSP